RTSQVPDIGSMSGAAGAAFSLKPGEISGPIPLPQKMAVLSVTDRQEPSATDPEFAKQKDSLTEQLSNQKQEQTLEMFVSYIGTRLEKEGKVKYNQAEINRLIKSRG